MPAWWIPIGSGRAARAGPDYTVVDPVSVLGTHLAELIRRYAHELFSRQDAKKLLDRVAIGQSEGGGGSGSEAAAAGDGAAGAAESAAGARVDSRRGIDPGGAGRGGGIHAQSGAADRVRAPGDPPHGGQAVSECAGAICRRTSWIRRSSRSVESAVQHGEQNSHLNLAPQAIRDILNRIQQKLGAPETPVVAVTSSGARYFLRQIAEASLANVVFPVAQRSAGGSESHLARAYSMIDGTYVMGR